MQLLMTFKIPTSMSGTQMNLSQTSSTSLLSQSSEEIRRGKAVISQGSINKLNIYTGDGGGVTLLVSGGSYLVKMCQLGHNFSVRFRWVTVFENLSGGSQFWCQVGHIWVKKLYVVELRAPGGRFW